jgi:hypothetical protein
MRKTPETDAFRDSQFTDRVDEMDKLYSLAEKLERERDEAIIKYTGEANEFERQRNHAIAECEEARGERDEAMAQNTKLRDLVEEAIDSVTCNSDLRALLTKLDQLKK